MTSRSDRRDFEMERLAQVRAEAQKVIDATLKSIREEVGLPSRDRLEFTVPGEPVPQPRGRAVRRGKFVKMLSAEDDHKVWIWRDRVIYEAKKAKVPGHQFAGPLIISVLFVTKFTGNVRKTMANPRRWHDSRMDLDNLMKSLKDALTEAGVWGDDGQIACYGRVAKVRAAHGEQPHTVVRIEPAGDIAEVWA